MISAESWAKEPLEKSFWASINKPKKKGLSKRWKRILEIKKWTMKFCTNLMFSRNWIIPMSSKFTISMKIPLIFTLSRIFMAAEICLNIWKNENTYPKTMSKFSWTSYCRAWLICIKPVTWSTEIWNWRTFFWMIIKIWKTWNWSISVWSPIMNLTRKKPWPLMLCVVVLPILPLR